MVFPVQSSTVRSHHSVDQRHEGGEASGNYVPVTVVQQRERLKRLSVSRRATDPDVRTLDTLISHGTTKFEKITSPKPVVLWYNCDRLGHIASYCGTRNRREPKTSSREEERKREERMATVKGQTL